MKTTTMNILIADDDESVLRSIGKALRAEGFQVLECSSGAAALRLCEENDFDVIIVDLFMPGLSGWEALERLTREFPQSRVIVFTGESNQQIFADAAGASALVEKPVELEILSALVRDLANQSIDERVERLSGRSAIAVVAS